MCGRFNVSTSPLSDLLLELIGMPHPGPDNVNTAPTETVVVLRINDAGKPELAPMRWWLTPYWSKTPKSKYSMFNAKSETADTSAAFREPLRRRRCVVPVSGFYEWVRRRADASGRSTRGMPYYIVPSRQGGLLLAGLWDRWRNRETSSGSSLQISSADTSSPAIRRWSQRASRS